VSRPFLKHHFKNYQEGKLNNISRKEEIILRTVLKINRKEIRHDSEYEYQNLVPIKGKKFPDLPIDYFIVILKGASWN
jgi:hypothetical protein